MIGDSKGKDHEQLEGAKGREVMFRPQRYHVDEISEAPLRVRYEDFDGRSCDGEVLNLSATGLAFCVSPTEVLRNGEALRQFQILSGADLLYSGHASVTNQRETGEHLIIGCSLQSGVLDTETILGLKERARIQRELLDFQGQFHSLLEQDLPDAFKAAVCDMRLFLERYKAELDAIDKTYNGLRNKRDEWAREILSSIEPEFATHFHGWIKKMFDAVGHLGEEHRDVLRHYAQSHLHALFDHAPIFHRSYHKPSGYAGDYIIMQMMYYAKNHYWGDRLFGKIMHRMGCSLTASKAAISRIAYLTEKLRGEIKRYNSQEEPLRIFSLACGPAKELEDLLTNDPPQREMEVTLFDQDKDALTYCHSRFVTLAQQQPQAKIIYHNSAVKQLIKDQDYVRSLPKQDIIASTGLFDYLNPRTAARLLGNLAGMLRPGGVLLVGNLDVSCDTKMVFDNLLDWYMLYRSKDDLLALTHEIEKPFEADVEAEATGVNLFLVVRKP